MTENGIRHRGTEHVQNGKATQQEEHKDEEFVARESPLTILIGNSLHLRAIYHIFIVILVMLFCDVLIFDFVDRGKINFGLDTVVYGFGDFKRGLKLWLYDLSIALAFYPMILVFEWLGSISRKHPAFRPILKVIGWTGTALVLITMLAIPIYDLAKKHLEIGSSVAVTCEMFRFTMKIVSVAAAAGPRCLDGKPPLPSFRHYVYFLFAPTLIYRDQYPRTKKIRWVQALFHVVEVAAIIFYNSVLWDRFILPHWSDFGKQRTVEAGTLIRAMFACVLPGVISFLSGFYCVLHAWQNAWAEVLRFSDRLFYEEWWTTSRFSIYYRRWNRVVHSWLRDFIYHPLTPLVGRSFSTFIVFFVSAVAHEVIIALSFGFFYPVLLIEFSLFGLIMVPITATSGRRYPNVFNLVMWLTFFIGNGLLWSLYPMEYFARKNCPRSENDSFFIPKSWSCPEVILKPNWTFQNPFRVIV